jgi:hypothetical protein
MTAVTAAITNANEYQNRFHNCNHINNLPVGLKSSVPLKPICQVDVNETS